jgi:RNA polymerase sigma factor (TIGR02999 family)
MVREFSDIGFSLFRYWFWGGRTAGMPKIEPHFFIRKTRVFGPRGSDFFCFFWCARYVDRRQGSNRVCQRTFAMPEPGDITRLLQAADRGNAEAAQQLFLLVQEDLKQIARKRKRHARAVVEASTTALIDNVFVRLVGQEATPWQAGDRRKFFGYASVKIHDLLIDQVREQKAARRGGGQEHVELADGLADDGAHSPDYVDLLHDLKGALERMEEFARDDAMLFRIRFFLGCTFEEAAEILGISKTEAVRGYQRTQLWLQRELKDYNLDT